MFYVFFFSFFFYFRSTAYSYFISIIFLYLHKGFFNNAKLFLSVISLVISFRVLFSFLFLSYLLILVGFSLQFFLLLFMYEEFCVGYRKCTGIKVAAITVFRHTEVKICMVQPCTRNHRYTFLAKKTFNL